MSNVLVPNPEGRGMLSVDLDGVVSTTGGAIGAIANPEGVTLQILRSFLLISAPSTGSATATIGVAADAVTSASDIVNALTINGVSAGTVYACTMGGDATKDSLVAAPAPWTATKYVTVTGSATTVGLKARLYIEYIRADAHE
jgi:hypothetical protein